MIENIIAWIIIILLLWLTFKFWWKLVEEADNIYEIILLIIFLFILVIPIIILVLDIYNIPSFFGYMKSVDSKRWFNFITNYASTISGSVVSGAILIGITIWQMKKQSDENNDNKRLQNAPTMKYSLIDKDINNKLEFFLENNDSNQVYNLFINVENIGLNHAKHLKFEIVSSFIKNTNVFNMNNEQALLKKDEDININIIFNFKHDNVNKKNNIKNIEVIFYYDDLLNNHYRQVMRLQVNFTNRYSDRLKSKEIVVNSIAIEDEEFLDKN